MWDDVSRSDGPSCKVRVSKVVGASCGFRFSDEVWESLRTEFQWETKQKPQDTTPYNSILLGGSQITRIPIQSNDKLMPNSCLGQNLLANHHRITCTIQQIYTNMRCFKWSHPARHFVRPSLPSCKWQGSSARSPCDTRDGSWQHPAGSMSQSSFRFCLIYVDQIVDLYFGSLWLWISINQNHPLSISHRIHGAGIYMLTLGIYWW